MKQSNKTLLAIIMIGMILSFGCNKNTINIGSCYNIKTVKIGEQEWMSNNLNVDHYRNGDSIPEVRDFNVWDTLKTGAWCYYHNDSFYGKTYGKLYNWYAVNDPRGLAPEGWHIPSIPEWIKLTEYLGGEETAGGKLKDTTLWKYPNMGATNESGFLAIPGGIREHEGFNLLGECGCFWSSMVFQISHELPLIYNLGYNYPNFCRNLANMKCGMSVRCIKDYPKSENKREDKNKYNYTNHKDFNKFWADFKRAVNDDDRNAILKMTNFPFEDNYGDTYGGGGYISGDEPMDLRSLTAVTQEEFIINYDKLFNICVRKIINNAKYKNWGEQVGDGYADTGPGLYIEDREKYLLVVPDDCESFDPHLLRFEKKGGVFKLSYIPYQE